MLKKIIEAALPEIIVAILACLAHMISVTDNAEDFGVSALRYFALLFAFSAVYFLGGHLATRRWFAAERKSVLLLLEKGESSDINYVFDRPLIDNVRYGDLQASDEECKLALDTVMLAAEYNYYSASDKERITLAREMISKPETINLAMEMCDCLTRRQIAENIEMNYPEIKIFIIRNDDYEKN
jgi:hypothetical protein